jgi:hypothetical protein
MSHECLCPNTQTKWLLVGRNNKSMECLLISNTEESTCFTYLSHADRYCTGLSSFVKEYVITRAIPIPELLCAFDVYLVGRRKLAVYSHLMHLTSVKNCKRRSRQPWCTFFKSSFRESERKLSFMLTEFDISNQTAVTRAAASVQYARGCCQPNHFVAAHAYFDWRRY